MENVRISGSPDEILSLFPKGSLNHDLLVIQLTTCKKASYAVFCWNVRGNGDFRYMKISYICTAEER